MISTVIVPLALVVVIDFIAIIYATREIPYLDDPKTDLEPYKTSTCRIKNNIIVFLLLVLNLVAGYLAWLPSTSYVAQPILCFFSVLFGFALCFLFIVRKPMTYPKEYRDDAKSKRSSSSTSSVKKAKNHNVRKNQHTPQRMAKENEYSDYQQPPSPQRSNTDSRGNNNQQSFSSLVGNGRRTAYFDPQSIPMSNLNRNRYANYGYTDSLSYDRYVYDNAHYALDDDDYF